jgi:hypothetical protein
MVRIKHTACSICNRVVSKSESMASDDALEVASKEKEALPEVSSSQTLDHSDDYESRSGGSEDTACESEGSNRTKVAAATMAAGITFDFGLLKVGKAHITSLENCHTWFLCQNQVLIVCMTQDQLFHTYGQKCSQITKHHE